MMKFLPSYKFCGGFSLCMVVLWPQRWTQVHLSLQMSIYGFYLRKKKSSWYQSIHTYKSHFDFVPFPFCFSSFNRFRILSHSNQPNLNSKIPHMFAIIRPISKLNSLHKFSDCFFFFSTPNSSLFSCTLKEKYKQIWKTYFPKKKINFCKLGITLRIFQLELEGVCRKVYTFHIIQDQINALIIGEIMKLIARGNCEIEVINSKFKLSLICVRNSFFFFFLRK